MEPPVQGTSHNPTPESVPFAASVADVPDAIFLARSQIDRELSKLQSHLNALKARRNALAPVCRLPVELLAEVFTLNAFAAERGPSEGDGSPDMAWTAVAHVCRYWRNVALLTPRMWTRLILRSEHWVGLQLERSKCLPVTAHIQILSHSLCKDQAISMLARNMHRVRGLNISCTSSGGITLDHHVCSQLVQPAPQLESFVFTNPAPFNDIDPLTTSHIPTRLFAGDCPSLRTVELRQCTWCWSTSLFCSSVTRLVLDGRGMHRLSHATEVLNALERMPLLEYLEMIHITPQVPWEFDPRPDGEPPIHLGRLRVFRMSDTALNCADVLYNISFPPNAQVVLTCHTFSRESEYIAVGCALSHRYRSFQCSPFGETSLQHLSYTTVLGLVQIQGWHTQPTNAASLRIPTTSPALVIKLYCEINSGDSITHGLLYMCRSLPLENVRTLYVPDQLHQLTSRAWLEVFASMRRLNSLWVRGHSARHLPAALRRQVCSSCAIGRGFEPGQVDAARTRHGAIPLLFPLLHTLILEEVDFSQDVCEEPGAEGSFFLQLQECVMERGTAQGASALELALRRCRNVVEEQIQDLRLVGAEVVWTGEEMLDFDMEEIESDNSAEDYESFYDSSESDYDDSDEDKDEGFDNDEDEVD